MRASTSYLLGLVALVMPLDAAIVVHEVVTDSRFASVDDEGHNSDWVELYNTGPDAVDLAGYGLSDDGAEPRKWVFPPFVLAPKAFLIVWCSGKDRTGPTAEAIADADGPLPFAQEFVASDAEWAFAAAPPATEGPPADWSLPDFDDSPWSRGRAPFSSAMDGATELPSGVSAAFFRHTFVLETLETTRNLAIRVQYDDGFGAYLGGQLVASRRFPEEAVVRFDTRASRAVIDPLVERIDLAKFSHLLSSGENVLAIALLNVRSSSRDMFLEATLGTLPAVFHTNFRLNSDGDTILLTQPDGTVIDRLSVPSIPVDQSWGREPDSGELRYWLTPSPGAPNTGPTSTSPFPASEVHISIAGGFYGVPFDVEITAEPMSAQIFYSLDGTVPTAETGTLYSGPLNVASTTILRAAAFEPTLKTSVVATRTYVFVDDVLTQDGAGEPEDWGGFTPDYEVDPTVVMDPLYSSTIRNDLQSIPAVALVMDPADLFEPTGIYAHPENRGIEWERGCSLEILYPAAVEAPTRARYLQVNCGTRIFGFGWRPHTSTLKHAFRVVFKREWGPSKLEYPFFPDWPIATFDDLVLRAQGDRGWTDFRDTIAIAQYIRDAFARYTARDMGKLTTSSGYVQLYLNGLYWGLYNPVERPDAEFMANHLGGNRSDYDALNARVGEIELIDGSLDTWEFIIGRARAGLESAEAYAEMEQLVDIDDLISYVQINFYSANGDWPGTNGNNMRVAGSPENGVPFKSFCWDNESTFGSVETNNVSVLIDRDTPALIYAALSRNLEFRMRFADHVYRNFFGNGPLTPRSVEARWLARAAEIDRAIVGESARWGDFRREPPYTRDAEWIAEQNRLRTEYFPQRSGIVVDQLRKVEMYPSIDPPTVEIQDDPVEPGVELQIHATTDAVYFTLDGSDPRRPGGEVSPAARLAAGRPIRLQETAFVHSRAFHEGEWSALSKTFVRVGPEPSLRITEILYHAAELPAGSPFDENDLEFVEVLNVGTLPVDLDEFFLDGGIAFAFGDSAIQSLAPGEHLVVVRSIAAFTEVYGLDGKQIAGEFSGRLANDGDELVLRRGEAETILAFRYDDGWFPSTDGSGHSLVIRDAIVADLNSPAERWNERSSWRPSRASGGSPGRADTDTSAGAQRPGDFTQDGRVNLSDATQLLKSLFSNTANSPPCEDDLRAPSNVALLDADGNGVLMLTDAIHLLRYLFQRGPMPALGVECVRVAGCPERCGG